MSRLYTGVILLALLIAVAGCGDDSDNGDDVAGSASETPTEAVDDDANSNDESETGEAEPTEPAATTTPVDDPDENDTNESANRTIEHALGETAINGVPERVVALEWTYVEDLLALGIQPTGVADVEGYRTWVNVEVRLGDDVADVGTRQEPSLESIASLEPDLIIGTRFRHEPVYDQLSDIAPTLIFDSYPEDESFTQFDEMEQTLMRIAQAVDREDEGQAVLDDTHAMFDEVREELEAADATGEFVLTQAFTTDSSPQMRVFIDTSMAVQILESIGLENAWEGEFDIYGFNTVGIESLTTVGDATFLYVAQDDDNPFEDQWADNPVWNDLNFVQEGRVHSLGGDTWLFGGPLSAKVLAAQIRDIFLGAQ